MNEARFPWRPSEPVTLTEDHIMSVLLVRRARNEVLADNLFSDPAWDILLELLGARLGGRKMTAADLATAIGIPLSTTGRWIEALEQRGLIEGAATAKAERSLGLSAEGASRMERLAGRWATAFSAIT